MTKHGQRGPSGPPRAVFDTNVVVSALLFASGRLTPLREIWRSGRAIPLVSRPTTEELLRVLAYPKFKLSEGDREDLLGDYLSFAEVVPAPRTAPRFPNCRDPNDLPFLELALAGKADVLISGDRDLLALASDFPVPIISPDQWLATLPPLQIPGES